MNWRIAIPFITSYFCLYPCSDQSDLTAQVAVDKPGKKIPASVSAKKLKPFEADHDVLTVSFSPDGKLLAAGTRKGAIVVWEMSSGMEKVRAQLGQTSVHRVTFSPTNDHLLTFSSHALKLWALNANREIFSVPFAAGITRFTSGGNQILCVPYSGKIQYRDAKDGRLIREITGRTTDKGGYAVSADSKLFALNEPDNTIRILNLDSGKDAIVFKAPESVIGFSLSGKFLACENRAESTHVIYDAGNGKIVQTMKFAKAPGRFAFSPDDKWYAAAVWSGDRTQILIREVTTGNEVLTLQRPGLTTALTFNSKGTQLANSSERVVQVWELSVQKDPANEGR